jgi:hypothetical protein
MGRSLTIATLVIAVVVTLAVTAGIGIVAYELAATADAAGLLGSH